MKFPISKKPLTRTTERGCGFHCLSGENRKTCIIDRPVNEESLYITEVANKDCPYLMKIGYRFTTYICICPKRREIYEKYSI